MAEEILFELDGLQEALSSSISLVSVIADGLSIYTRALALSGREAQAYVDALYTTYDTLEAIAQAFREKLEEGFKDGALPADSRPLL